MVSAARVHSGWDVVKDKKRRWIKITDHLDHQAKECYSLASEKLLRVLLEGAMTSSVYFKKTTLVMMWMIRGRIRSETHYKHFDRFIKRS